MWAIEKLINTSTAYTDTTHNIIHIGTIYTYFIHIKYLITNKEEADGELGREKDIITNEIFWQNDFTKIFFRARFSCVVIL